MKAEEYAEMYKMDKGLEANKATILEAVHAMLGEAPDMIKKRGSNCKDAKNAVYQELRLKFKSYLKHIERYSDGKMKLFDAIMIPLKGERRDARR